MWPPLLSRYFRSLLVQSFQVCFDQMLHKMSRHHNQFTQRSDRAVLRQNIKKFMENVIAKDSGILCITDVSTCQRMNSHYTSYRKRFAKLFKQTTNHFVPSGTMLDKRHHSGDI